MTAVARLFVFTLTLVALGSSSACLTTLCLSALCGDPQNAARPAQMVDLSSPRAPGERSDHNCNLMRF
jgi:hypothetical protein